MLAIDTNIVVRYLTADHPEQSPKAKALIDSEDVFVCTTVLLETEWVLRSVYDFASADIVKALTAFAGLPRVTLEDAPTAAAALDWTLKGLDFADALHLAKTQGCDGFAASTAGSRRPPRTSAASKFVRPDHRPASIGGSSAGSTVGDVRRGVLTSMPTLQQTSLLWRFRPNSYISRV